MALSFAGEQRAYVDRVASQLRDLGVSVFYDLYHEVELWGKDLYSHLDHYADKVWTTHERRSAQARAFREHEDYILPVRFDDTEIEGIRETIGYLAIGDDRSPEDLANLISLKVGPSDRPRVSDAMTNYMERVVHALDYSMYTVHAVEQFVADIDLDLDLDELEDDPTIEVLLAVASEIEATYDVSYADLVASELDDLRGNELSLLVDIARRFDQRVHTTSDPDDADEEERLRYHTANDRDHWLYMGRMIYQSFTRMTEEQRLVVGAFLAYGCPGELPKHVHIDPVELRRLTGMSGDEIVTHLSDVRSLGFTSKRRPPVHVGPDDIIAPDAYDLTLSYWAGSAPHAEDSIVAASALLKAVIVGCCHEHGVERVRRCDFSEA